MADLSSHSPIYVRSNGSDSTGDGSSGSPYLTAQKAFEIAYTGTGNKVLDFGSGDFGGVNLTTANASNWPSRIAVRGTGATQSFVGGVVGNGVDAVFDFDNGQLISAATNGKNITIIGNNTINIGNVISNGGNGVGYYGSEGVGGIGGTITLTDVVVNNIQSNGGFGTNGSPGGLVNLTNSVAANIDANGGNTNEGSAGGGGTVNLTQSSAANISVSASGIYAFFAAGNVNLINSSCVDIYASSSGMISIGAGGNVTLSNSVVRDINVSGASGYGGDVGGAAGSVTLATSTIRNIYNIGVSTNGTVTDNGNNTGYWNGVFYLLSVATTLDQNGTGCWENIPYINASKRVGINGSSILGLV